MIATMKEFGTLQPVCLQNFKASNDFKCHHNRYWLVLQSFELFSVASIRQCACAFLPLAISFISSQGDISCRIIACNRNVCVTPPEERSVYFLPGSISAIRPPKPSFPSFSIKRNGYNYRSNSMNCPMQCPLEPQNPKCLNTLLCIERRKTDQDAQVIMGNMTSAEKPNRQGQELNQQEIPALLLHHVPPVDVPALFSSVLRARLAPYFLKQAYHPSEATEVCMLAETLNSICEGLTER